jgi:parallel beta-helix repeat protein
VKRLRIFRQRIRRASVSISILSEQGEDRGTGIVLHRRPLVLLVAQHVVAALEEDTGVRVQVEGMPCRRVHLVSCEAFERDHVAVVQMANTDIRTAMRAIVPRRVPRWAQGKSIRVDCCATADTQTHEGHVVSVKNRTHGATLLTDVPVHPGDSGSAVLCHRRLVAVCQGMVPGEQGGTAVAIPLSQETLRRLRRLQHRSMIRRHVPRLSAACLTFVVLGSLLLGSSSQTNTAGLHLSLADGRAHAHTAEIAVLPGESIQAALNRAPEGALVRLNAGVWEENISIRKSLTLVGSGPELTTLSGRAEGFPVVSVMGVGKIEAKIEGLTICEARGEYVHGIQVAGRAHARMVDLELRDHPGSGIMVTDFSSVEIENCSLRRNWWGMRLFRSATALVRHCTLSEHGTLPSSAHGHGIDIRENATAMIIDCTVTENDWGIIGMGSASCTVKNSTISGNRFSGVVIHNESDFVLEGNRLLDNQHYGIMLPHTQKGGSHPPDPFAGVIRGRQNYGEGNGMGDIWPSEADLFPEETPTLDFLLSEQGGELNQH